MPKKFYNIGPWSFGDKEKTSFIKSVPGPSSDCQEQRRAEQEPTIRLRQFDRRDDRKLKKDSERSSKTDGTRRKDGGSHQRVCAKAERRLAGGDRVGRDRRRRASLHQTVQVEIETPPPVVVVDRPTGGDESGRSRFSGWRSVKSGNPEQQRQLGQTFEQFKTVD
jgi:hypothetical protein